MKPATRCRLTGHLWGRPHYYNEKAWPGEVRAVRHCWRCGAEGDKRTGLFW